VSHRRCSLIASLLPVLLRRCMEVTQQRGQMKLNASGTRSRRSRRNGEILFYSNHDAALSTDDPYHRVPTDTTRTSKSDATIDLHLRGITSSAATISESSSTCHVGSDAGGIQ